jgi:hypothetical protein
LSTSKTKTFSPATFPETELSEPKPYEIIKTKIKNPKTAVESLHGFRYIFVYIKKQKIHLDDYQFPHHFFVQPYNPKIKTL